MGFLDKLRRKEAKPQEEQAIREERPPECAHRILLAQWDDPSAMGDESRANSYRCDACGQVFSREEGESLRRVSTEVIKDTIARS